MLFMDAFRSKLMVVEKLFVKIRASVLILIHKTEGDMR